MRQTSRERPEAHGRGAVNVYGVADVAPRMKGIGDGCRPGDGLDGAADRPIERIARWDLDEREEFLLDEIQLLLWRRQVLDSIFGGKCLFVIPPE